MIRNRYHDRVGILLHPGFHSVNGVVVGKNLANVGGGVIAVRYGAEAKIVVN
jgi:hypothetical protein